MNYAKDFNCDKAVLLNLFYDTLDKLAGKLPQSNSAEGEFEVLMEDSTSLRITMVSVPDKVIVTVYPQSLDDYGWSRVLLEELEARWISLYGLPKGEKEK